MKRPVRIVCAIAVLAAAGACEKQKDTVEEAPIQRGSTINRPPPPPPSPPADLGATAGSAATPPPAAPAPSDPAATPAPVAPGGSAPSPAATDDVRPPVAADLARYLEGIPGKGKLRATIATTMGDFHCELFEDVPMTVANFVGLATGKKPWKDPVSGEVKRNVPFFNGIIFHRVIPDFMVQVGDPLGKGIGGPGYEFDNEIVLKHRHDAGGVLSMANAGPGTNGSQFFITEKATPWLDDRHTVFGKCAEVDLVKKITGVPRGPGDKPLEPVTIKNVTISRK
ncbi:MAG: peptidylprolyl isomerase [Myxococcales bacterium]|nr:peptidylprolyl isomerase [Myxococcales bacterium]